MTILEQIKELEASKVNARTNNEYNNIENKILKLAKKYNDNGYEQRFLIINNKIYGLEMNR